MASEPVVDLKALGLVVAGGSIGVAVRALLTHPLTGASDLIALAFVTSAINVTGSLALGIVVGWLAERHPRGRVFLGTGVLGGFTTYSAFAVQVVQAGSLRTADAAGIPGPVSALLVAAISVVGGLIAATVGLWIGRRIADAPGEIEPSEDAE